MAAAKDTTKKIEEFTVETQKSVNEQIEKFAKGFEDVTAFNQETVEALVKSSGVAAKAAEDLNAEVVAYTKKAVEESVAAVKDLAGAKSVTELFEKQSGYAKASFDVFVKQATKMNEMALAAAKEASEPLGARVTAATEIMKSYRV